MSILKQQLTAARSLIKKGWTQWSYARDADGEPVPADDMERAVCWCMIGATDAVCGGIISADLEDALRFFVPGGSIVKFNDAVGTTQADVLAVFDKAIANAPE